MARWTKKNFNTLLKFLAAWVKSEAGQRALAQHMHLLNLWEKAKDKRQRKPGWPSNAFFKEENVSSLFSAKDPQSSARAFRRTYLNKDGSAKAEWKAAARKAAYDGVFEPIDTEEDGDEHSADSSEEEDDGHLPDNSNKQSSQQSKHPRNAGKKSDDKEHDMLTTKFADVLQLADKNRRSLSSGSEFGDELQHMHLPHCRSASPSSRPSITASPGQLPTNEQQDIEDMTKQLVQLTEELREKNTRHMNAVELVHWEKLQRAQEALQQELEKYKKTVDEKIKLLIEDQQQPAAVPLPFLAAVAEGEFDFWQSFNDTMWPANIVRGEVKEEEQAKKNREFQSAGKEGNAVELLANAKKLQKAQQALRQKMEEQWKAANGEMERLNEGQQQLSGDLKKLFNKVL